MKNYIDRFESIEQIRECAKYYVNLLGLQDWKIIYVLGATSNENNAGECETIFEEKCAKITIDSREHTDLWVRQPQELVLIHELIHCKIILIDNNSVEGRLMCTYHHALVDDWARSIFYARYGLTNEDMYF